MDCRTPFPFALAAFFCSATPACDRDAPVAVQEAAAKAPDKLLQSTRSVVSAAKQRTTPLFVGRSRQVWTSARACEEVLAEGHAPRSFGTARIATWNIRFFPDGVEDNEPDNERRTDVEWLSCAIAWLDLDVLVVQEFKRHAQAVAAGRRLVQRLNERTGGDYKLELSPCAPEDVQHVGFLYDAKRVRGSGFAELKELSEGNCNNAVSPGLVGYFEYQSGLDHHLLAYHTWAGDSAKAHAARIRGIAALEHVISRIHSTHHDRDLIVTGDFNTSGCSDCSTKIGPEQEVQALKRAAGAWDEPFRVLSPEPPCSEYRSDRCWVLDHFLVDSAMREVAADARAAANGFCSWLGTAPADDVPTPPVAEQVLSDHCPIVLELSERDLD